MTAHSPRPPLAPRRCLFICSGNYYRSRFAQAVFNHLARRHGLEWEAFSRGFSPATPSNIGPLSPHARKGLEARGIPVELAGPDKRGLAREDLERAARIIALKEAEHRPLMRERFPGWETRTEYWTVHDLDAAAPAEALALIEDKVRGLVAALAADEEEARA